MSTKKLWRIPKGRLFSYPVPKETRTYKPVSHKQLAEVTLKAIKKAGFTLSAQEYSSAKEGAVANARYVIKELADDEMALEIGWQNSYNKSLSLKFAIGTRIFICANGCVSGNFGAFKKKHMGDVVDFAPTEIGNAIENAKKQFEIMREQRDRMKKIVLTSKEKAEIVGVLFLHEKMINSTQLNIIREEMDKPTHDYKCPNTLWELYQYTTFSMKNLHPSLWMDDHIDVHRFFNEVAVSLVLKTTYEGTDPTTLDVDFEEVKESDSPTQITLLDEIAERSEDIEDSGDALEHGLPGSTYFDLDEDNIPI